jgi:hypothetical protein
LKDITKSILKRTIILICGSDEDIVHTRFVVVVNAQHPSLAR